MTQYRSSTELTDAETQVLYVSTLGLSPVLGATNPLDPTVALTLAQLSSPGHISGRHMCVNTGKLTRSDIERIDRVRAL